MFDEYGVSRNERNSASIEATSSLLTIANPLSKTAAFSWIYPDHLPAVAGRGRDMAAAVSCLGNVHTLIQSGSLPSEMNVSTFTHVPRQTIGDAEDTDQGYNTGQFYGAASNDTLNLLLPQCVATGLQVGSLIRLVCLQPQSKLKHVHTSSRTPPPAKQNSCSKTPPSETRHANNLIRTSVRLAVPIPGL